MKNDLFSGILYVIFLTMQNNPYCRKTQFYYRFCPLMHETGACNFGEFMYEFMYAIKRTFVEDKVNGEEHFSR